MVFSWLEYFLLIGRLLLSLEFLCGLQIFILSLSCVIPVPCVTGCANSHIFMNCRWIEPRGLRSTLGHFRCCGRRIHRILQRAQEGFLPMHPQKLFHSSLSIYPTHQNNNNNIQLATCILPNTRFFEIGKLVLMLGRCWSQHRVLATC